MCIYFTLRRQSVFKSIFKVNYLLLSLGNPTYRLHLVNSSYRSMSKPAMKDDPAVKQEKPVVLTRHQSALLNTRQLRNKDSSIKKISEITQMLLGPSKDKSPKSALAKTKKSPKEKKDKGDADKGENKKKRGRKRKGNKATSPAAAKRPRAPSPRLLELLLAAEEQSLDEDDWQEILTCESPVWWEDPPHEGYDEEPILRSSSFSDYIKDVNRESNDGSDTLDASCIQLPVEKQKDNNFMNKRTKLESLLGNMKNKVTSIVPNGDTNRTIHEVKYSEETVDKESTERIELNDRNKHTRKNLHKRKSLTPKSVQDSIQRDNENREGQRYQPETKTKTVSEDQEMQRSKRSSESTEGDPFCGLHNEELLRDFENMDIPIEHDAKSLDDQSTLNSEILSPFLGFDKESQGSNSDDNSQNADDIDDKLECSSADGKSSPESVKDSLKDDETSNIVQTSDNFGNSDDRSQDESTIKILNVVSLKSIDTASTSAVSNEESDKETIKRNEEEENCELSSRTIQIENDDKTDDNSHKQSRITKETNELDNENQFVYSEKTSEREDQTVNNTKPKPKKINRDQLMAVYKIITNDEYRQQYANKNKTSDFGNLNTNKTTESIDYVNKILELNDKLTENTDLDDATEEMKNKAENHTADTYNDDKKSDSVNKSDSKTCKSCKPEKETSLVYIIPDAESAKYCLKCSSIFETETCCYCAKKAKIASGSNLNTFEPE